jgi:hypothetical protein
LAIVVWQVVARVGDSPDSPSPTGGGNPTTTSICPDPGNWEPAEHPDDGRVHGGRLSYPRLRGSWSAPGIDPRLPFGRDVVTQMLTVHEGYSDSSSWVASVLVGELYAGDGFYSPEEASDIVTRCIVRTFYGDAAVERNDIQNAGITFQGYSGWIIETDLSFDIENLPTKSERVVIIIVATSELTASLFYSSIPEDSPQEAFDGAQIALDGLRVDD